MSNEGRLSPPATVDGASEPKSPLEHERPLSFALIRAAVRAGAAAVSEGFGVVNLDDERGDEEGQVGERDEEFELLERRSLHLGWRGITRLQDLDAFSNRAYDVLSMLASPPGG